MPHLFLCRDHVKEIRTKGDREEDKKGVMCKTKLSERWRSIAPATWSVRLRTASPMINGEGHGSRDVFAVALFRTEADCLEPGILSAAIKLVEFRKIGLFLFELVAGQ